jgi:uncharacterized NAD(P)/FAD-binding protein YdhS
MHTDLFASKAATPLKLVICGGGAGAILILRALAHRTRRAINVTVIEPRADLGLGVAYSTTCPLHLLNTRACNMSVTQDADDFVRWLRVERPRRVLNWNRDDFAPRRHYGDYLQAQLAAIHASPHIRLSWLRSTADSVIPRDDGWDVVPAHGEAVHADAVILATGNEPPRPLAAHLSRPVRRLVIENPWDSKLIAEIPSDAAVLLAGTSLTAVDAAVELLQRGHRGPIFAVSRRGLLPRSHGPIAPAPEGFIHALPSSLRGVIRHVRALSANDPRGEKWRRAFTELRGIAPALWRGWSNTERRRFLRHVRPFWDAHRHRLAPRVYAKISRAISAGQLTMLRGRIEGIEHQSPRDALRVTVRQPRAQRSLEVARIINCTGPEADPARAANPLLQGLVGDSIAQPDPLGLGLVVDSASRVVSGAGSAHRTLHALGSLTRGSRWEVTSIPEVREQANVIVRELLHTFANDAGRELPPHPIRIYRNTAA